MTLRVLVTGGAGYIGSHTCVALLEAGHRVTVLDNLCNSSPVALERVQEIAGKPLAFIRGDVRNPADLQRALAPGIDAVIHFAALKSFAHRATLQEARAGRRGRGYPQAVPGHGYTCSSVDCAIGAGRHE